MSLAVRFGSQAQQQGDVGRVMVVLITDGRANVSLAKSNEDPDALAPDAPKPSQDQLREEVLDMAKRLMSAGMQLLVIDTGGRAGGLDGGWVGGWVGFQVVYVTGGGGPGSEDWVASGGWWGFPYAHCMLFPARGLEHQSPMEPT